jgi:spermidine synthase
MELYGTKQYIREEACSSDVITLYPVNSIIWSEKTEYANAIIADCPNLGKTLFLDSEIQSSESDEAIYHECLVHPTMFSASSRQRVLIIGGGEGATLREVLKWSDVEQVKWIDIDGHLVDACRKYLGWVSESTYTDPRVTYIAADIRNFLLDSNETFDVVIIDLPDIDADANMFDTHILMNVDFWLGIQKILKKDGVFVTHCGPVRFSDTLTGIAWIKNAAETAGIHVSPSGAYHTVIPSFQDDWGFLMSRSPQTNFNPSFDTKFLTNQAYTAIFTWAWSAFSKS